MNIYIDFQIKICEDRVKELLSYGQKNLHEEIVREIKKEIKDVHQYISPKIIYATEQIKSADDQRIMLKDGVNFKIEKLKKCEYVIIGAATLGKEIDKKIEEAFDKGDFLKAMILDSIGIVVLESINNQFLNFIAKSSEKEYGITQAFSPGSGGWKLEEQQKVGKILSLGEIGIQLSESNMLTPLKSTTFMYGVGKGLQRKTHMNNCLNCSMKNCIHRKEELIKVIVHYRARKISLNAKKHQNLFELLRDNNIFMLSPCNGKGICGKCKVLIQEALVPSKSDYEFLSDEEIKNGYRLACQVSIISTMNIYIDDLDLSEGMRILSKYKELDIDVAPIIYKKKIAIPKPTLEDQRSDLQRIVDTMNLEQVDIDLCMLKKTNELIKKYNYEFTACFVGNKLISLEPDNTAEKAYGICIDIGTTTIACNLVHLVTGKVIDSVSRINKQTQYGSDVISRISYTMDHEEGLKRLNNCIIEQLNQMIDMLSIRNGVSKDHIYDITVVGNTAMIHIFLGLFCKDIAKSPYVSTTLSPHLFKAKELGLKNNSFISILPGISSFVGSDILAGILATDMVNSEDMSLLIDLGTNGEIVLGNKNKIMTCSTAAGPAFEGVNIYCGVGGINGAISKVDFAKEKIFNTIGDEEPIGICGSGVLDIVSELLKHKIINHTGKFIDSSRMINRELKNTIQFHKGQGEFIIYENHESSKKILFTQKDVREVQLAKSAIYSGIKVLVKKMNLKLQDIKNVYLAGGFGNYMNIDSAIKIGMIPKEYHDKVKMIGNAASSGARLYLLSTLVREETKKIITKTKYIELSGREDFNEYFIDSMILDEL